MEITIIFKIAAVGIIVTVLGQVLKQSGRDEQAFLLSLVGLVIVLFWVIPYIKELFEFSSVKGYYNELNYKDFRHLQR